MTQVNKDLRYIDNFTFAFLKEFPEISTERRTTLDCVFYRLAGWGEIIIRPMEGHQTDITFIEPVRNSLEDELAMSSWMSACLGLAQQKEVPLEDAKRMYEEAFQKRRGFMQDLQNKYWTRVNQELSTLGVEPENSPHTLSTLIQEKVTIEAKQEEIIKLLEYNLENSFKDRINPSLWDIVLEELEDKLEIVILQCPEIKEYSLTIHGEFITQWVNENSAGSRDHYNVWRSASKLFSFNVLPLGTCSKVIGECHASHPKIVSLFNKMWSELLSDFGLNEDRTPASKNENGTPAVIENNAHSGELDATDEIILELTRKDSRITDNQLGAKIGISRQAANTRRCALQKAGYKVR